MSDARGLTVDVHEEADGLWAEVIELPGCFASGRDLDELRESLSEAIALFLDEDSVGSAGRSSEATSGVRALDIEVEQMRIKVPV